MTLVAIHARAMTRELVRYPAYVVPTVLFPTAFFLFFVAPAPGPYATIRMAAFAGFAAIGVAFFQFGVGIAVDRASPWEAYLRTLPVTVGERFMARVVSAAGFAVAAAASVVVTALLTTDATLDARRWAYLALALLLGTVPFALLGIALGYWAPQRGALPIANLLYLGLSYAGGLWIRPSELPHAVRAISPYLPTRALADLLRNVVYRDALTPRPWLALGAFSVIFAGLAVAGYRRDEGKRYR
jgi:ABC-2 type transport system permease protein